ncbi:MAG: T9SS type A sorting domain-containing protein [Cytophagaceae bacterium]
MQRLIFAIISFYMFNGFCCYAQTNVSNNDLHNYYNAKGFNDGLLVFHNQQGLYHNYLNQSLQLSLSSSILGYDVANRRVAWLEMAGSNFRVMEYNGSIHQIQSSVSQCQDIKRNQNAVIWNSLVNGNWDLYKYEEGQISNLTNTSQYEINPQISESSITWSTYNDNGFYTLYEYVFESRSTEILSNRVVSPYNVYLFDNIIYWSAWDGNDYEIYYKNNQATGIITNNSHNDYILAATPEALCYYAQFNSTNYIYVYDGAYKVVHNSTNYIYETVGSGKNFAFSLSDGQDPEIFFWNGTDLRQITDNSLYEYGLSISENGVAWTEYSNKGTVKVFANEEYITFQSPNTQYFPILRGSTVLWSEIINNTAQIFIGSLSPYKLSDTNLLCNSVNGRTTLSLTRSLKPGVIGIDFTLSYTGSLTLNSVSVSPNSSQYLRVHHNIRSRGFDTQIYFSIYLEGAPASVTISDFRDLLILDFTANTIPLNTFLSISNLQESFIYGTESNFSPLRASFSVLNKTYEGRLLFRNSNQLLTNSSPRSTGRINNIINSCNANHEYSVSGSGGTFIYNPMLGGNDLVIKRDVPCINVIDAINGTDWLLALEISTLKLLPNNYQLVAADVNMDGKVTAGDATLISSRAVSSICEYPQAWNYQNVNGVPTRIAGTENSFDWLFTNMDLNSLPLGTRHNVPRISNCLPVPAERLCSSTTSPTTYFGILLGDIDGNYESLRSSRDVSRISARLNLVRNQKNVSIVSLGIDTLKSVDLSLAVESSLNIKNVRPAFDWIGLNFNIKDSLLLVTSIILKDTIYSGPVFYIESDDNISFSKAIWYVNGEEANVSSFVTQVNEPESLNDFIVSPNPSNGIFRFTGKLLNERYTFSVTDVSGNEILSMGHDQSADVLDLTSFNSGIYFLSVTLDGYRKVLKLIKY